LKYELLWKKKFEQIVLILKIESKYDSIFSRNNFFFLGNNNNYFEGFLPLRTPLCGKRIFLRKLRHLISLVSNAFNIHCVRNHDTLRFIIICRATKLYFLKVEFNLNIIFSIACGDFFALEEYPT
jgi:hypothetical protein